MKLAIPPTAAINDAEALSRIIDRRKRTNCRLALDCKWQDAANALVAFYSLAVERRGRHVQRTPETMAAFEATAKWLTDEDSKFGLMILGSIGNGKTTLAESVLAILDHIAESRACTTPDDVCIATKSITAKEVCQLFVSDNQAYAKLHDVPQLLVDDLGDEPSEILHYGQPQTPVQDLLAARYKRQRLTITTTNLTAEQLKTQYGARLYDRFREMFQTITMLQPSFRG